MEAGKGREVIVVVEEVKGIGGGGDGGKEGHLEVGVVVDCARGGRKRA